MCSNEDNYFDNDAQNVPFFRTAETCMLWIVTVLQISTKSMFVICCFFMFVQIIGNATALSILHAIYEMIFVDSETHTIHTVEFVVLKNSILFSVLLHFLFEKIFFSYCLFSSLTQNVPVYQFVLIHVSQIPI